MAARSLAAMEVPVVGTDGIQWCEVSVPSSVVPSSPEPCGPPTDAAGSCHILGDPQRYIIWRIHKNLSNTLELLELSPCNEFPMTGLRFRFQDSLCPFAVVCTEEVGNKAGDRYFLYALTVSGVAYVLKLRNFSSFVSGSTFPQNELEEVDVQTQQVGNITSVAATLGCFTIGWQDGSIGCFQLGSLNQSVPGFMYDLRDDAGMGRLWGLMARRRASGAVQDLVILAVHGRKLLFVIHVDGSLRVWDLHGRVKLFTRSIILPESTGVTISKLWLGDAKFDASRIPLAILYRNAAEADKEMVEVYNLHITWGDKVSISLEPRMQNIHLEEGKLLDLKIAHNKLWILKEDGSMSYDLLHTNIDKEHTCGYGLQESFVADQLFQGSEHSSDDLMWTSYSIFSSMKDQIVPFVSSIFLRRLLHPGVFQNATLRATLQDHSKYFTDSEFQSLTVDGLKKELISVIESEGVAEDPISGFYYWKNFCTQYFNYWCQNNAPYSLHIDYSTGAVGLIRKSSISLFRCLEDIELLIYGCFDESGDFANSSLVLPNLGSDSEILLELLRCISSINHQLGRSAAILYYELLVNQQMMSSEDIIPRLLKMLDTGYSSSVAASNRSRFGADAAYEKEQLDHKNQRKFSVEMLCSFLSLRSKASSWARVLDILEKFLKYLAPHKRIQTSQPKMFYSINSSLLVQATSQVARVMVESGFDILLLLGYLVNISGQLVMDHREISRIQLKLIPMIEKIIIQWLVVHLMGTTLSESPRLEDFSSQLSSLHIDNRMDKRPWDKKLGRYDFTLACIFLLKYCASPEDQGCLSSRSFPNPDNLVNLVRNFSSWILWGVSGEESLSFLGHILEITTTLLGHHQYAAAESLLVLTIGHSCKEKISQSIQTIGGEWCACFHLLGFSLVLQAQSRLPGFVKEQKIRDAVRCFFRAASGEGSHEALQGLSFQTDLSSSKSSPVAWKLLYYQWVMQLFEQYNMSEAASQFALAALEQVDLVLDFKDDDDSGVSLLEPADAVKGRLWANVFKFTLDINHYRDAYCAIIANPDEDSKYICLRRFLIVLCERGDTKILCDGELPFVGLVDKVVQELVWKAERSDITAKPNPYKLLYAFEMHRHNWRKAATYMYQYSVRIRKEVTITEQHQLSLALQDRLHGLSAAINALSLVHPAYAWIDESGISSDQHSPNKKARKLVEENSSDDLQLWKVQRCVDIQKLEKEYVLTLAQYLLVLANIKPAFTGSQTQLSDTVDLLVEADLCDMAFTVILKFWKGSGLKRELERVFVALSQKCCPSRVASSVLGANGFLLTYGDETSVHAAIEMSPAVPRSKGANAWETLELYLETYRKLHPRLPATVAETLLHTDSLIELPLWLVHMFKGGRRATSWGMTGQEPDAATLFRLYVDYARYAEATNLLLEYLESFASLRPADVINRKRMSAVWFPYTAIERLWCQLEESRNAGHMVEQCDKLKSMVHSTLLDHLKQMKVDSEDAIASSLKDYSK